MEEKIIARGLPYKIQILFQILLLLPFGLFLFTFFILLGTPPLIPFLIFWAAVIFIIISGLRNTESITVTDKRVFGKVTRWFLFTRRVDLPLDSISAVSTTWPRAIAVSSASGSISFKWVKNQNDVYRALNILLMERQNAKSTVTVVQGAQASTTDELKKYKELLDSNIITQQEFDEKKRQLLGL